MSFSIQCAANNVWYGTFAHFNSVGICHGFATRIGGLSEAPFYSLNVGLRSGDDSKKVVANRERLFQALGIAAGTVVSGQQVHGDTVAVVTERAMGRGALNCDGLPGTDALVTNAAGVALMIFFADCVPVLFVDPKRRAIGACHAGWRGTAASLAAKTVLAMQQHFGTEPGDCLVGIGPSIGQCCYEVDEPVIACYREAFSWWEDVAIPHGSNWRLDLRQANCQQLEDIGVHKQNIVLSNVCTACNTPLFYSYRAEHGKTGVLAAVIRL